MVFITAPQSGSSGAALGGVGSSVQEWLRSSVTASDADFCSWAGQYIVKGKSWARKHMGSREGSQALYDVSPTGHLDPRPRFATSSPLNEALKKLSSLITHRGDKILKTHCIIKLAGLNKIM